MLTTIMLLVSALIVGVLVGCVGIGGVLVTSALVYVGGPALHLAIDPSKWDFFFSGVAGAMAFSRSNS